MSTQLVLLGTDHCSLCEEALELLFSMPELAGHSVRVVDVADDERLFEDYADRLPVLQVHKRPGDTSELAWPFDGHAILRLVR